jgi:imidazole glycerol phosphate synthase subunit HisF
LSTSHLVAGCPATPVICCLSCKQLDLLKAHRPAQQQQALSEQVTCLKAYISSVADAELDGDDELLAITAAHTSSYAVQLIKAAADPAVVPCKVSGLQGKERISF